MDHPARPPQARTRAILAVAVLAVVVGAVYLVADAFGGGAVAFRFVDELPPGGRGLEGRTLKVAGAFVEAFPDPERPGYRRFVLEKNGRQLTVVAEESLLPEGFGRAGGDVVVDGEFDGRGLFLAALVTLGCPSRYESRRR